MTIKFVSYTGSYPCLCGGVLTLNINGNNVTFGGFTAKTQHYPMFWTAGGYCNSETEEIISAPWEVEISALPEFLKPYSTELINIFNKNVPFGCCGGCM